MSCCIQWLAKCYISVPTTVGHVMVLATLSVSTRTYISIISSLTTNDICEKKNLFFISLISLEVPKKNHYYYKFKAFKTLYNN